MPQLKPAYSVTRQRRSLAALFRALTSTPIFDPRGIRALCPCSRFLPVLAFAASGLKCDGYGMTRDCADAGDQVETTCIDSSALILEIGRSKDIQAAFETGLRPRGPPWARSRTLMLSPTHCMNGAPAPTAKASS
jgi:hypothetical protein